MTCFFGFKDSQTIWKKTAQNELDENVSTLILKRIDLGSVQVICNKTCNYLRKQAANNLASTSLCLVTMGQDAGGSKKTIDWVLKLIHVT